MGTFGGGVGGIGEVINLKASTPGQGSPPRGIDKAGSAVLEALPIFAVTFGGVFVIEFLVLFRRPTVLLLFVSSSEEAS